MGRDRKAVTGSERQPVAGARILGRVADNEQVDVTLRLRGADTSAAERVYRSGPRRKSDRPMTREELAAAVGASQADVDTIESFAASHGLTLGRVSRAERTVHLHGPASAMSAAFDVQLDRAIVNDVSFRQRTGDVHIPSELASIVTGVFGLDDREQARPKMRIRRSALAARAQAAASFNGYMPKDLSQAYEYPVASGKGQCIAIIELGGGYRPTDLNTFFSENKTKMPRVVSVAVDGGRNAPT